MPLAAQESIRLLVFSLEGVNWELEFTFKD